MTIVAASWRSATPTIVSHTGTGGPDRDRLGVQARFLRDAHALVGDAAVGLGGCTFNLDDVDHAAGRAQHGNGVQCGDRPADGHDQRVTAREQFACAFDGVLGVLRSVVAEQERAGGARCVPMRVDRVGGQRAGRSAPRCARSVVSLASWRALGCAARAGCGRAGTARRRRRSGSGRCRGPPNRWRAHRSSACGRARCRGARRRDAGICRCRRRARPAGLAGWG